MLRLVTDIEDVIYRSNDNKPRADWPDDVWQAYCRIRHKILDMAGDIGRLPDNIT